MMAAKSPQSEIRTITIPPVGLESLLGVPKEPKGIVLFAHGSGSGRLSPRNNFVAQALRDDGLATLLFDLLTVEEARDRRMFSILICSRDGSYWRPPGSERMKTPAISLSAISALAPAQPRRLLQSRRMRNRSQRSFRVADAQTLPGWRFPRSALQPY